MVSEITLRTCSTHDIDILIALGIETFKDTFEESNTAENMNQYLRETFHRDRIAAEINEPGSVFFLAEEQGAPIGYARVRNSKTPDELNHQAALEIERLYAKTNYIGKGLGKLLM